MKKVLLTCLILSLVSALGCAKQPKPVPPTAAVQAPSTDMCIPEWEITPPNSTDGFYASGQAKLKLPALTREASDSRAIRQIGRQIESKTASMLKDFMQQSGADDDASVLQFVQSVSKSVSSQTISGARVTKRQFCPDGTVHSLAFYPVASYKKEVKKEVTEEAKKDAAKVAAIKHNLYDEFKSKKALENLDSEIDKMLQ